MDPVVTAIKRFFEANDRPILFAGAGVAARAGLPAWEDYLQYLGGVAFDYDQYTKYQMDRAIQNGRYEVAATYYKLSPDIPESTRLAGLVAPLKKFDVQGLEHVVKLPISAVITTNFDRCLFDAIAKFRDVAPVEVNSDDASLSGAIFSTDLYIARIHGKVENPASMVLDKADFEAIERNQSYKRFLINSFTKKSVIFIGFSFLDPAIRAVLRSTSSELKSLHGKEHLALVPSDASGEFLSELERHSIKRVTYDPRDSHAQLWTAIEQAVASLSAVVADVQHASQMAPFETAHKYLATVYARAKMGREASLSQTIAEGIVSGVVRQAGDSGINEEDISNAVAAELLLKTDEVRPLVNRSLAALTSDGIVSRIAVDADGRGRYNAVLKSESPLEHAVMELVDGTMNRFVVREAGEDNVITREFLRDFFHALVLQRGWELGAAFASRSVPELVEVEEVMNSVAQKRGQADSADDTVSVSLVRAVKNLLSRPDDREALLLTELGRVAFGLELLLEAPHDSFFFDRVLPQRVYLDANVLMPAIVRGHPHHELLSNTISILTEAAARSSMPIEICVLSGFLNEIVSHRRLAVDVMKDPEEEKAIWVEREAGLRGNANVNVFVGAYLNLNQKDERSFAKFVDEVAPYKTEGELRQYLIAKGIRVIRDDVLPQKDKGPILHALEVFYGRQLETRRKSPEVVSHDAVQMAVLYSDLQQGRRSLLVSADRSLRLALTGGKYDSLRSVMISHLGFAQLVDLLIGGVGAPRGMASLLWTSAVSSDTEQTRNYLIDLALKEHNAALLKRLPQIVDEISEKISDELASKRIDMSSDVPADRVEANYVFGQHEAGFYRKMREELRKIDARD